MANCRHCFAPLADKGRGRSPVFCSQACKQANYRLIKPGFHVVAERNRQRSRLEMVALYSPIARKPLQNATGADLDQLETLRKAAGAVYSQVYWVGVSK